MSSEQNDIMQTIIDERFEGIWPKNPVTLDQIVKEVEKRLRWEHGDPPKPPLQDTWKPAGHYHVEAHFFAKGTGQGSSAEYSGQPGKGKGELWSDDSDNMAVDQADRDFAASQGPDLQGHQQTLPPSSSGKGQKGKYSGKWGQQQG